MWWHIWTRTGGESVMEVDSDYRDGGGYVVKAAVMTMVVYGSGDDNGAAAA